MLLRKIKPQDDAELFLLIRHCLKDANLDIPGTAYFDESIKKMSEFYRIYCKNTSEIFGL